MGPLTKRIQRRRNEVVTATLIRHAREQARIAVELFLDEKRDGGLLIHQAIEQAEARRG